MEVSLLAPIVTVAAPADADKTTAVTMPAANVANGFELFTHVSPSAYEVTGS